MSSDIQVSRPPPRPLLGFDGDCVERHRVFVALVKRLLWGADTLKPTHALARWLFLRALGAIYLVAFLSLWSQILGLVGESGILPVRSLMSAALRSFDLHGIGVDRYRILPTLCWIGSSDVFLHVECAAGVLASLALILGVAPVPCLGLLWLLYLSLATVGRVFFGYQWDNLLLEAGFLAISFAPLSLRPRLRRATTPPRLALWLLRLLLFKLMFSSGWVKISSGDPSWHDLSALSFHYQTQPLPTWLAWYANQLPLWLHKASCAAMFAIEIGAPLMILAPRRPRLWGCGAMLLLQALIALTGNYTFFNLLAIALCVLLVDDTTLRWIMPRRLTAALLPGVAPEADRSGTARRIALVLAATIFVPISLVQTAASADIRSAWFAPIEAVDAWLAPLRTVSGYGLFAVMTTDRKEISIEGSDDGVHWVAYGFKFKPGDVNRRPGFVAPHQPRVDWQMWFAALGSLRDNRWLVNLCIRLLEGSRPVLALLGTNPFPAHPPRYVRAEIYRYTFTEAAERRATGAWWKREIIGEYMPSLSLAELRAK